MSKFVGKGQLSKEETEQAAEKESEQQEKFRTAQQEQQRKSLYEQLQEHQQKKDEDYELAYRKKYIAHHLNEDELEYFRKLKQAEDEKQQKNDKDTQAKVRKFKL